MLQRPTKPGVGSSNLPSRANSLTVIHGGGASRPPAAPGSFIDRLRDEAIVRYAKRRAHAALTAVLRMYADPIRRRMARGAA